METIGEVWNKYKPTINTPDWLRKMPLDDDTREAIERRIKTLEDWINVQIMIDGGISEAEHINKIRQEINWLKAKLDEFNGLKPEVKPSPFIQVPYYINNPCNPYIDITGEDVINYVAEEVSDFKEID